MLLRRAALVLCAALVLTLPAAGEFQPLPRRSPRTERVIEALLIWRLVDELDLTDQQIARIFPQIKALKNVRIELGMRKVVLQRELRALLGQQPRSEDLIRAKIAELDQVRIRVEQQRARILREIYAVLSVDQQAKFALIQETFEAETIRLLEEVRQMVEEQRGRR